MRLSSVVPVIFLGSFALLGACTPPPDPHVPPGPGTAAPSAAPAPTASAAPGPSADPYAPLPPFGEEAYPTEIAGAARPGALPDLSQTLPAPPATCEAWKKHKATETPKCEAISDALEALDRALANEDATQRDAALAGMEGCKALPSGMVRALRIDLAPAACGDVLAKPILDAPPADLKPEIHETLFGQALAARLGRAAMSPPTLAAPHTRKRVEAFIKGDMATWIKRVATTVHEMSQSATQLRYYGGAIAAVAAGTADLRLVEVVRDAPIPDEFKADKERREVYEAALDEQLEARKTRGRNAALAGLKRFAEVGAIEEPRVAEARRLLSKLYGGRRVDALDALLLPAVPAPQADATPALARLARKLPTFYAAMLFDPQRASPAVWAALSAHGLPVGFRRRARSVAAELGVAPFVIAGRVHMGQIYWRAADFEEAAALGALLSPASRSADMTFFLALLGGLRGGPKDAAELMLQSPSPSTGTGRTKALDALAAAAGDEAGRATFDAALLRELAGPGADDPVKHQEDLARRYNDAASKLTGSEAAEARKRAEAATATAAALVPNKK